MEGNSLRTGGMVVFVVALLIPGGVVTAGEAKGKVSFKGKTATVKYAYLVKGPDDVDTETTIRRVILSQNDIAAKIQACTTMKCSTNDLTEGATVDLDAGPRLNYWVTLNDQLVQHSGTKETTALKTTKDEPGRLAGTLHIDDTAFDGPKVEAEFDAALLKEFTAAR